MPTLQEELNAISTYLLARLTDEQRTKVRYLSVSHRDYAWLDDQLGSKLCGVPYPSETSGRWWNDSRVETGWLEAHCIFNTVLARVGLSKILGGAAFSYTHYPTLEIRAEKMRQDRAKAASSLQDEIKACSEALLARLINSERLDQLYYLAVPNKIRVLLMRGLDNSEINSGVTYCHGRYIWYLTLPEDNLPMLYASDSRGQMIAAIDLPKSIWPDGLKNAPQTYISAAMPVIPGVTTVARLDEPSPPSPVRTRPWHPRDWERPVLTARSYLQVTCDNRNQLSAEQQKERALWMHKRLAARTRATALTMYFGYEGDE